MTESLIIVGDSAEVLRTLAAESVHSIVTDPPAGIGFMGKAWDSDKGGRDSWIKWLRGILREALRVIVPGGYALVWAIPKTSHWAAMACEIAGWEIRDVVTHHYGQGFPKSLNVSKAIDAHLGTEATPEAEAWEGWGTALKPASEHWILCRKPLAQSVARNVLEHGTGGLNVDGCRVGEADTRAKASVTSLGVVAMAGGQSDGELMAGSECGRWPPNLVLTHSATCTAIICAEGCPVREIDEHSGVSVSREGAPRSSAQPGDGYGMTHTGAEYNDQGGASRFFPVFRYAAKPSRAEREAGLSHLPPTSGAEAVGRKEGSAGVNNPRAGAGRTAAEIRNIHPTVKSQALMRWLVRLVTPPGGRVLDPFTGSGSTGVACAYEGFSFTGVELSPEYADLARARIAHASGEAEREAPLFAHAGVDHRPPPRQTSLFDACSGHGDREFQPLTDVDGDSHGGE